MAVIDAPTDAVSARGSLFPERLETDRLLLERFSHETVDLEKYYELCSHHNEDVEEVTRYLPWSPHETIADAADYVDDLVDQWREGTRAEYVIRPRPPEDGAGEFAGTACLIVDWETKTATPGIWLRKRFWGRGYAAERAAALIDLAFERLDLELVAVPIEDGNEKSRSAVESYVEAHGGGYDGVIRNATKRPDGRIVDHHRYTITREQYRSNRVEEG